MKTRIVILASLLIALTGIAFVVPVISSAKFDAVACPGEPCVTRNGGSSEYQKWNGVPSWGNPGHCDASVNGCTGETGCCQQCLNWGYEVTRIVGYCYNKGGNCNQGEQYWANTCPV